MDSHELPNENLCFLGLHTKISECKAEDLATYKLSITQQCRKSPKKERCQNNNIMRLYCNSQVEEL